MDNCDVWDEVDFGEGPVRVRCTKSGDHEDHICTVGLQAEEPGPVQRNVFDRDQ